MAEPVWLTDARAYIGFHEKGDNQGIDEFVQLAGCGANGEPWCAIFANAMLRKAGLAGSGSAMARSFETSPNFTKLSEPQPGCIVTMWRGSLASGSGHVTFWTGDRDSKGNLLCLGGNQNDSVCIEPFSGHITGYWWPKGSPANTAPPADASDTPFLEAGDSGPAVSTVQRFLSIEEDGEFGPNTTAAVKAYQLAHPPLEIDGQVGQETWAALLGKSSPAGAPTRQMHILATTFGGSKDHETSAYDDHVVSDTEMTVSLPYRFSKPLPGVRVYANGRSIDCTLSDVGPWNTKDPYWLHNARPEAETGTDMTGRHTNKAGIDLAPAVARFLGTGDMGYVDWEFITNIMPAPTTTPPALPVPAPTQQPAPGPVSLPTPAMPDFSKLVKDVQALVAAVQQIGVAFQIPTGNTGNTGTVPPLPVPAPVPSGSKASVWLSVLSFGVMAVLQVLGVVGAPIAIPGLIPAAAVTQAGTLSSLIPVLTGLFGQAGGFSGIGMWLSAIVKASSQVPPPPVKLS